MHNSSLVAIVQYFWWIRTSVLYGNQQKFNIEAVNDYPPIRFEIWFKRKFPFRRSLKAIRFWHKDYNLDRVQNQSVRPCPGVCQHATFHPNPCNRQTDRHGQMHLPPPLTLQWLLDRKHSMILWLLVFLHYQHVTDRHAAYTYVTLQHGWVWQTSKDSVQSQ